MIRRTYISKFTSIYKDSEVNTGINPVAELFYGNVVSRCLLYFDHNRIKKLYDDKVICNKEKVKHYLCITNAGSIDFNDLHQKYVNNITEKEKIRATSFDLIFFIIPKEWDGGKGFDHVETFFNQGYLSNSCNRTSLYDSSKTLSYDGANWYQNKNGYKWDEEGILSIETLSNDYDLFLANKETKYIFAKQHFDIGNENIRVDITDIVNKYVTGEMENNGIGIAFSPIYELKQSSVDNYVGLLTHKTNTFFEPYIETNYNSFIDDDRASVAMDKKCKLYLYCNVGDNLVNLDELPTCSIGNVEYEVKQETKGVYYVEVMFDRKSYQPKTMLYDVWSNIKYDGVVLDDVELDFVLQPQTIHFNIGNSVVETQHLTPTVSGIKNDEKIKRGDIRKLIFNSRVDYTKNLSTLKNSIEWRMYIKDGTRELDVVKYENVHKTPTENFVTIDTNDLIPQRYYIDVKYKYSNEEIINHNVLTFNIVDDLNNKYA